MVRRWGRLIVAFAAAVAVWAIALPARAAAPFCDPRGATMMAPAPQLQPPETSIDVGTASDDCDVLLEALRTAEHGRAPAAPEAHAAGEPVVGSVAPRVLKAEAVIVACERVGDGARAGEHLRVERPPRA